MASSDTQIDLTGLQTSFQNANQITSRLIETIQRQFAVQSPFESNLSIVYSTAGGTTVAVGPGISGGAISYLCSIHVTTPATTSTVTGLVYDAASPANVASSNIMSIIPSCGIQVYNIPFVNGLTIQPSSISTHRVSVYFINEIPDGA